MEEMELKTSLKQRILIGAIAVIMVGSMIASYAAIVINGNKSSADSSAPQSTISDEKKAQYEKEYEEAMKEFKKVSADDYAKFIAYKDNIKSYNEAAANSGGVSTKDLLKGDGHKLEATDKDYLAYYVGWCADETIFDSSFDDSKNPTSFAKALDASVGMIEGWNQGVAGMRLGGVREVTISSELAYGDTMEICGGKNKPLKFIILPVENKDPLKSAAAAVDEAFMKLQYANYGIDYEQVKANSE
ncbi:FKBP-type peptidyl-prolyl cis-trans isomerase [Candidatus Saccharibacteria bacterium]|nr:FKBP-type peptidyl-prolyl cis-trans isomerase [Candidatus Saccharibacteria bacterium]